MESLPAGLRSISAIMPLTHGLHAIRTLFDGGSTAAVLTLMSTEALIGAVYALLGYGIFRALERLALAGATLELY